MRPGVLLLLLAMLGAVCAAPGFAHAEDQRAAGGMVAWPHEEMVHALGIFIPDRMRALDVSPDMVVAAIERENTDIPAGRLQRGASENLVRVKGRIADPRMFCWQSAQLAAWGFAASRLGPIPLDDQHAGGS